MEIQKPVRLTKLPKNPVGFLPVLLTPLAGAPPYSLILVKDEEPEPRLGSHLIEVAQTMEQAQTLLEFYLTKSCVGLPAGSYASAAEGGIVVPLRLDHVFAWLLKTQVAMPLELLRAVKGILHQVGIVPRVRYYQRRPWQDLEMGKVPFNLVFIYEDDRRRLAELVRLLKRKSAMQD